MKLFLALCLRSLLALALVGGGLSSWAMSASTMSMSAPAPTAAHHHAGQAGADHHQANPDSADSPTFTAGFDHLADSDQCQQPSCSHLCAAAGLAVPVQAGTAVLAPIVIPPIALESPTPRNITTPPQRPPRA